MRLSVGIATWNRCDLLRETLESLTRIVVPDCIGWELLVCDNNSSDGTRAVVESRMDRLPLRYLHEPRQGLGHAHNRLLAEASSSWLLILDDDVRVDPGWLAAYVEMIGRYPKARCLAGQVLPWLDRPARGQRAFLLKTFPWVHAVVAFDADAPMSITAQRLPHGPNMAVHCEVLRRLGGFDAGRGMIGGRRVGGEDTQVGIDILEAGHEGWMVAAPKVHHYIPRERTGLPWFCKWSTGTGWMWVHERGPAPRGRFGLRVWLWRLVLSRLRLAVSRCLRGNPKPAYEALADACAHYGYLRASGQRPMA